MKFGVTGFVTDEGIRPDALARAVEERGFESLWLPEHSHVPVSRKTPFPGGGEMPRPYYRAFDPFIALTAAAAATSELLLGTGVALIMQRDVIHTAKETASLDVLSGGRLMLGVGIGWNREEMENHGTDPRTRGRLIDEQLAALKEIWTKDEAEFHGEFIDFDPIYCWPKPAQKPHPPVYVGGHAEASAARAIRHQDGWLPTAVSDPALIPGQLALLGDRATDLPITIAVVDPENQPALAAYVAAANVERITLVIPTEPESETLRRLDALAAQIEPYR